MKSVHVTLVEAQIIQILKDEKKDKFAKILELQSIMDTFPERDVLTSDLQGLVLEKMNNMMRK